MASDRAIGRYRRWYGRLLHLYPRPFRQRFGEPMAQTFTDLIASVAMRTEGSSPFAIGTFAETSAGILRENMTQLMQNKNYLRWVIVTAVCWESRRSPWRSSSGSPIPAAAPTA